MNISLLIPTILGGMWGLYGTIEEVPKEISTVSSIRVSLPSASDDGGWHFAFGRNGQVIGNYYRRLHGSQLRIILPSGTFDYTEFFNDCRRNIMILEDQTKRGDYFRNEVAICLIVKPLEDLPFCFLNNDDFLEKFFLKNRDKWIVTEKPQTTEQYKLHYMSLIKYYKKVEQDG